MAQILRKLFPTHGRMLIPILALSVAALVFVQVVRAAVTLIYFLADGQNGRVVLEWKTATEIDNAGFFINRSLSETSGFVRISPFIPADGDGLTGATYTYTDTNVTNGTTYWYLLESIDFGQNTQFYQPPASAIPGDQPDSTSTVTATQTGTSVSQASQSTPTTTGTATHTSAPTSTATSQPTSTGVGAYPGPATATNLPQVATQTPVGGFTSTPVGAATPTTIQPLQATPSITPTITATFLPLPELVLQFPAAPESQSFQAAPAALSNSPNEADPENGWRSPGRYLFMGFIVTIWILLGGWFFFSIRKIE